MNEDRGSDWFKCLSVIESCYPDMQLNYVYFVGWACVHNVLCCVCVGVCWCILCVHVLGEEREGGG